MKRFICSLVIVALIVCGLVISAQAENVSAKLADKYAQAEFLMLMRLERKMTESKRDTSYTKLWRIDGIVPIHEWKRLITHYYRDNYLIGEYFDGKDVQYDRKQHTQEQKKKTPKLTLTDLIPIDFSSKDGLQSYISFREYIDTANQDVTILPSLYSLYQFLFNPLFFPQNDGRCFRGKIVRNVNYYHGNYMSCYAKAAIGKIT